MRHSHEFR